MPAPIGTATTVLLRRHLPAPDDTGQERRRGSSSPTPSKRSNSFVADWPSRRKQWTHRHLYALTEFDDEALILRTCEFAMSDAVKTQNAPFVLAQAIGNRHHGPAAWAFVRDHWEEANERFPTNTIVRMASGVRLLNTPEAVDDVRSFFTAHPIVQAAKTLEQILERQRLNAALRDREADRLAEALG